MSEHELDISFLQGQSPNITSQKDNNEQDKKIPGIETSIFNSECYKNNIETEEDSWYKNVKDSIIKLSNSQPYIAPKDATIVAPIYIEKSNTTQFILNELVSGFNEQPQPFKFNSNIRTNYTWSVEKFEETLDKMLLNPKYNGKFNNSVLRGKASAFVESAQRYNLDPRMLVAVAMQESGRGISKKAQNLNNIGGLIIKGKYHKFDSVEASIDSIAKTINTRYLEGYTTPSKIASSGKYCAKNASDEWLNNVQSYLKQFDKYYQK